MVGIQTGELNDWNEMPMVNKITVATGSSKYVDNSIANAGAANATD